MEFPEGIKEENNRVPWVLKIIYLIIASVCVGYLVFSFKHHGTQAVTSIDNQVSVR